jgi:AraC-like DNA-binding protein
MLNGDSSSKDGEVSALARFTMRQFADGPEFKSRQRPMSPDEVKAFPNKETPACETNHSLWDLGVIWLEQTSFPRRTGKAQNRRKNLAGRECIVCRQHGDLDALPCLRNGTSPDSKFRVLAKSFDKRGAEQVLMVYLPLALFRDAALAANGEPMVALNSCEGAILADYLFSLARELPSISKEHWPALGAATCTLALACLAPALNRSGRSDTSSVAALRERVRRVVRQQMSSPNLKPNTLGHLVAMSRSKLYRIFESNGGVARFIQQERLGEARRRLAETEDKTSISTLASEIGFLDHSSFSRAFKLEYGCSPSEFREMASANRLLEAPEDLRVADSYLSARVRAAPSYADI